jgi:hypothetical protein
MDNFCVPEACQRGEANCVCAAGNSCAGGDLTCTVNICRAGQVVHVGVRAPGARSCDVLIEIDKGKAEMRTAAGVRAKNARRGRRIAYSFIGTEDLDLPNRPVSFALEPSTLPRTERVALIKATCYDRLGHALTSAEVSLEF